MQRLIDAKEAIEELMSDSCYECSWGSDNPLSCDCDCTYREAIRMAIMHLRMPSLLSTDIGLKQNIHCSLVQNVEQHTKIQDMDIMT